MKEKFEGLADQLLGGEVFLEEAVEILERSMIRGALERCGGNQSAAAKQLGIHRNTLQRKAQEYGLTNGRPRGRKKPPLRERRAPHAKGRKTGAA
jgi:DNA-binding NtrC family response regulator